jgi:urea transporter
MRILPFPILAAPFILVFWLFWPIAEEIGMTKLEFPPFGDAAVQPIQAIISAMGAALFAGVVISGVLFFVGLLVSNWRHATLAVCAAGISHAIALWWEVPGEQINSGLAGFNAVLAAVAIYALATQDIRVALLGSVVASAILPVFGRFDLVSLAAGFDLVTWGVIVLGWVQRRYFATDQIAEPDSDAPVPESRTEVAAG